MKNINVTDREFSLGDRMKQFYEHPMRQKVPRRLPIIMRLDGRAFHTLARKMNFEKPFDRDFINGMKAIARKLVDEVQNTKFAYIQSDEISLLLIDYENFATQAWFDGNIQKMTSVSAGIASALMSKYFDTLAVFDCRVFVLPREEVVNYFIWRQQDWIRNSVQMLARSYFSHNELYCLNQEEMRDKLHTEKGVMWKILPNYLKYGTCYYKDDISWNEDNDIPIFSKARGYIDKYVYPENEEK